MWTLNRSARICRKLRLCHLHHFHPINESLNVGAVSQLRTMHQQSSRARSHPLPKCLQLRHARGQRPNHRTKEAIAGADRADRLYWESAGAPCGFSRYKNCALASKRQSDQLCFACGGYSCAGGHASLYVRQRLADQLAHLSYIGLDKVDPMFERGLERQSRSIERQRHTARLSKLGDACIEVFRNPWGQAAAGNEIVDRIGKAVEGIQEMSPLAFL